MTDLSPLTRNARPRTPSRMLRRCVPRGHAFDLLMQKSIPPTHTKHPKGGAGTRSLMEALSPLSLFPPRQCKKPTTFLSYLWSGVTGLFDYRWLLGMQPAETEKPATDYEFATVTVLVPARNEERHLREAVESLLVQTHQPLNIIIVNDGSTDATGRIADDLAEEHPAMIDVIHTQGTGSKAGALNAALDSLHPKGELTVVMDADTVFEPTAIEKALPYFYDPAVAVVCGHVLPKPQQTGSTWPWAAKLVEYVLGQGLTKEAQNHLGALLVTSGCFSMYMTSLIGRFSDETVAEDMHKTWELQLEGYQAAYAPNSHCYAAEPETMFVYWTQRSRWLGGYFQCYLKMVKALFKHNVRLACVVHYMLIIAMMDVFLLPIILYTLFGNPLVTVLIPSVLDISVMAIALSGYAYYRGGTKLAWQSLKSLPASMLGSIVVKVNFWCSLRREWFSNKPLTEWAPGH